MKQVVFSRRLMPFISLIGFYLLTYAVVWIVPYLFTDDYSTIVPAIQGSLKGLANTFVLAGRPLYSMSLLLGFTEMRDFTSLRFLRLISVLGIGITSWIGYQLCLRAGWNKLLAFMFSSLLGVLPAFQVFASWAIAFPYPWATALAALSVYLIVRSWPLGKSSTFLGILCLILAFNIYQPSAMCFVAFSSIFLFKKDEMENWANVLRKLIHFGGTLFISLLTSFLIQRTVATVLIAHGIRDANVERRAQLVHDFPSKLHWFVEQPLVSSLNLINISPTVWFALVISFGIIIGLWFYFGSTIRFGLKLTYIILSTLFIPMSYLPNLAIEENWASYRSQVGLECTILVLCFLAGQGIYFSSGPLRQFLKSIGLVAVYLVILYTIHNEIVEFVLPQYTELGLIRYQIDEGELPYTKKIYLVPASPGQSIAPGVRYDEFGIPSTYVSWAQQTSVYVVLNKINPDFVGIPVVVVHSKDEVPKHEPNIQIVDLSHMSVLKPLFGF